MKKIILGLLLFCTTAFANPYGFYQIQMPVVCGTPDAIESYIKAKNFDAVGISLGRAGSQPDGEPVYMVTTYEKDDQVLVTVDLPSAQETCILFHTYNKSEVKMKIKKGV